jgi:hypothetical protein
MFFAAGFVASFSADRYNLLRVGRGSGGVIALKSMEQAGSCQGQRQQQNKPAPWRRRVATPGNLALRCPNVLHALAFHLFG